ncbi:hypothetical protein ACFQZ4_36450 [Catellatospora coxensis]|uniref:Uncharacterized protein n=1 Tax=Catellatospora coxensis TaxID=310354 RepID=A0A8J3KV96_9ACTN|nr:hypothetical protein [Catellatospora coxensis]GIG06952.1 hypothetical protein Cco03nite_36520 [Catellatospora coxensis]
MTVPARRPMAPALLYTLIGVAALLVVLTGAAGGYVVWAVTKAGSPAPAAAAVAAADASPSPTGGLSPSPTPSVTPSPTAEPSPSPTKTPAAKPSTKTSPKPTAKVKALSLQADISGSKFTATITATVTGTGPVRIMVTFVYPKGGVASGEIVRYLTVNGTGGTSVKTASTSVALTTVCAHPDTPLGRGISASVQVPPYGDFHHTEVQFCP